MDQAASQPILFEPIYQERVWGGRRLEGAFARKLPSGKNIGESWEIADRADAQSIVRQGTWRGCTLHELWTDHRREIFGDDAIDTPRFPLLVKLLDARDKLSLQVHPPAEVASALGGEPKTEMWYIAAAEPDADLFVGLRRGVTRAQFEQSLGQGNAADFVHRLAVKTGDAIFVPSGRVHAIGAGNLIVEIQQNSDTTYRVFDWNRTDTDGQPRQLHTAEAMRSIDFDDFEPELVRPRGEGIVRAPEFVVERWDLSSARRGLDRRAAAIFFCLTGSLRMTEVEIKAGEFFLAPASADQAVLEPTALATSLLRVTLPPR